MNSYNFNELISGYFDKRCPDFDTLDNSPMPKLSRRHRKNMKKIFRLFEKNNRAMLAAPLAPADAFADSGSAERRLYLRRRPALVFVIILAALFLTGFSSWQLINGFLKNELPDNTRLFAVNIAENCPSTIEEQYGLSVLPEGYELYEVYPSESDVTTVYKNSSGEELVLSQCVKSTYDSHINTEYDELQETDVTGYNAVYIEFIEEWGVETLLIWDSKDYILELTGVFTKDEMVNLAVANEKAGFQRIDQTSP